MPPPQPSKALPQEPTHTPAEPHAFEQHSLFEPHARPSAFFVHGGFASTPESTGVDASVPPLLLDEVPVPPPADELVDPLDDDEEEEGSGAAVLVLSSPRLF